MMKILIITMIYNNKKVMKILKMIIKKIIMKIKKKIKKINNNKKNEN